MGFSTQEVAAKGFDFMVSQLESGDVPYHHEKAEAILDGLNDAKKHCTTDIAHEVLCRLAARVHKLMERHTSKNFGFPRWETGSKRPSRATLALAAWKSILDNNATEFKKHLLRELVRMIPDGVRGTAHGNYLSNIVDTLFDMLSTEKDTGPGLSFADLQEKMRHAESMLAKANHDFGWVSKQMGELAEQVRTKTLELADK